MSESYITKLYFRKYFLFLFPIAVLISAIGFAICFLIFNGKYLFGFILFCTFLIISSIIIPASFTYDEKQKGVEAYQIFCSEGFTCKFCDTYRRAYIDNGNPFPPRIIICASYYEKIGENHTANMLLKKIKKPERLDKESRFNYYLEMMMVCGKNGDALNGEIIRNKNIGFIQKYVHKKRYKPEYRINMSIALSLVDCACKRYGDALSLLNYGYKPNGKNDENFLNILITAVYIYSKAQNDDNLITAVKNAKTFLNHFTKFKFPWQPDYYNERIKKASKGNL